MLPIPFFVAPAALALTRHVWAVSAWVGTASGEPSTTSLWEHTLSLPEVFAVGAMVFSLGLVVLLARTVRHMRTGLVRRRSQRRSERLLYGLRFLEKAVPALGIAAVVLGAYLIARQSRQAERYDHLVAAIESHRARLAESHVWLEEALEGDTTVDPDREIFGPLTAARELCGTPAPAHEAELRDAVGAESGHIGSALEQLCRGLDRLTALTGHRWANPNRSGPGTPADSVYDAAYREVARTMARVDDDLRALALRNQRLSVWIGSALLSFLLLLSAIMVGAAVITRRAVQPDLLDLQRLAAIVESSSDAMYSLALDGSILNWNDGAVRIYGHAAEEMIGRDASMLLHPARRAEADLLLERMRRGEHVASYETEGIGKQGRRIQLALSAAPILDESGEVSSISVVARDISARKRAEQELICAKEEAERANRAKSEFLSRMSHELRTPLNSVIGFASLLRVNRAGHLEGQELAFIDRILSNGQHLLGLINQVLDLAKVESGKLEAEHAPFALDRLIRETVEQLQGSLRGKSVELRVELPGSVAPMLGDAGKLKQILLNLVGNAIKFTERGSVRVVLEVDPVSRKPVRVDVHDTGIGIPARSLATIFRPFEQAEQGIARRFAGTGLGLSISRSFAELLGYGLDVASEPGRGSTFRLLFRSDAAAPAGAASHDGPVPITIVSLHSEAVTPS